MPLIGGCLANLAELIVFSISIAIMAVLLLDSISGDDVVHNFFVGIQAGIITFLGCLDYGNPISLIYVVLEIASTFILLIIINYFLIFRKIEVSNGKKFLLSLCCAVINAPYHFLIPFGTFELFNSVVMSWMGY